MISLLGVVLIYWGFQMLRFDHEVGGAGYWLLGVALLCLGAYVFGISLDMPRTGRAFG